MAKAYVIFTEEIHDPAKIQDYAGKAFPTLLAAGAKVLAASPASTVLEGEWHGNQTVLLEFESAEAAQAWYDSEGYSAVKPMRFEAATSNAAIIPGFDF